MQLVLSARTRSQAWRMGPRVSFRNSVSVCRLSGLETYRCYIFRLRICLELEQDNVSDTHCVLDIMENGSDITRLVMVKLAIATSEETRSTALARLTPWLGEVCDGTGE